MRTAHSSLGGLALKPLFICGTCEKQWMTNLATPNLPSRNFSKTARFYEQLGFTTAYRDEGWMILERVCVEGLGLQCSPIDRRVRRQKLLG